MIESVLTKLRDKKRLDPGMENPPKPAEVTRTGTLIEWTPVRKRTANRMQARGNKVALAKFMKKWSQEDGG